MLPNPGLVNQFSATPRGSTKLDRPYRKRFWPTLEQKTLSGLQSPRPATEAHPRGPKNRETNSRSSTWKNEKERVPTHEQKTLKFLVREWNVQSWALFFCSQRGAELKKKNSRSIISLRIESSMFSQYCVLSLNFVNLLGPLGRGHSVKRWTPKIKILYDHPLPTSPRKSI